MAAKELIGKLGLDTTEFQRSLKTSMQGLEAFGKRMQDVGKTMSLSLTAPIAAFGALSVKAFDTQIQAENRLKAAIQASGGAVDANFAKYAAFASELQSISTVGDEATLAVLATAESMGVSGDAAIRAAKNAVSLEKALGISASSAIRMTAALEQGDATMLTRYIPALRGVTDEGEKVRIAQESLANMFGQVTAEAQSGLGPLTQLKNSFGDFMEVIGGIVLEGLQPMFQVLKSAMGALQSIDKNTLKWIVTIGGLVAAVGPLLAGLGFLVTTILPAMVAGFAAIFSPITLVVAAIAGLAAAILYIWDNWSAIKERITDWSWWKNMLIGMVQFLLKYNPMQLLIKPYEYLLELLGIQIPNPFEEIAESLEQFKDETKEYEHSFGSFGDAVKNAGKKAIQALTGIGKASEEAAEPINNLTGGGGGGAGISRLGEVTQIAAQGFQQLAGVMPGVTDTVLQHREAVNTTVFTYDQLTERQQFLYNLIGGVQGAFQGMFETMLNGGSVFQYIGNLLKRLVAQLAAAAVAAAVLSALLPGLGGTGLGTAMKSFTGGASSFGGIFKNLLGFPALANGGITTGPTLAMVGDNRSGKEAIIPFERMGQFLAMAGAANTSKVEVTGVLRGEDLYLSSQNYINRQNRRLG